MPKFCYTQHTTFVVFFATIGHWKTAKKHKAGQYKMWQITLKEDNKDVYKKKTRKVANDCKRR